MVTTNYPYIIPEGVVWSARTGRLMTVAEAAAELEAQGGGGGGTPQIGAAQVMPSGAVVPAGWWIAYASGVGGMLNPGPLVTGVNVSSDGIALFHSDGASVFVTYAINIVAVPVSVT